MFSVISAAAKTEKNGIGEFIYLNNLHLYAAPYHNGEIKTVPLFRKIVSADSINLKNCLCYKSNFRN